MSNPTPGTLFLVATPIGNLSDISERAIKTLQDVVFIAAEDTRVTRHLLEHLNIKKPVVSYYRHNSRSSGEKILSRILGGENCALVTDAGTPGISDPGEDLVCLCAEENIPMVMIPGPCAAVSALALSGLSSARFSFEGFLSTDKKKRTSQLKELKNETRTMVFYEAPHKLMRTLNDMLEILGNRRISISREMTKMYEETLRLTISSAVSHFENKTPRGEFVLVVEGVEKCKDLEISLDEAVKIATTLISDGDTVKDAVKKAADMTGCSKNLLYNTVIST